jgi:hypothetical protein
MASGQMPSMDTNSSASMAPMASAPLVNCQASRPMMDHRQRRVASSTSLTPFSVASIGGARPGRMGGNARRPSPGPG